MNWVSVSIIIYVIVLVLVCLRIIYETHNSTKTIAYLLLCILAPVAGILFYLAFGFNYWRTKLYRNKFSNDVKMLKHMKKFIGQYNKGLETPEAKSEFANAALASMLIKNLNSPLTASNAVKVLINGEEKFAELLEAMSKAKNHIHIEYYIFEQDEIGSSIIEMLIKKAQEGIRIRFIYDDFGSPTIKKKTQKRMQQAGIEVYPFYKIHFYLLANRFNYRNHRKIVVIDGQTGFVGGINVSDKYINNKKQHLFWRDTHLRIDGPGVYYLQYLFLSDWNFCSDKNVIPEEEHFVKNIPATENKLVQIVSSGPNANQPAILFSILQAIYLAQKEILITTPYFIPEADVLNALRIAASSGLSVKLLVPGTSDSLLVNAASKSNYNVLLQAGVEIYLYKKGFVHAKTLIADGKLTMIGTANMDYRSFDLNFEVNVIVYDTETTEKMRAVFFDDIKNAEKINAEKWGRRKFHVELFEKVAALFSPFL